MENNSDQLRSEYLTYIYDIGQLQVHGKCIIKHLEIERGFSLWWMTLLAEKSPVKSKVPDFIQEGKKEFASYFGAKVDVKVAQKGNGKLIIPFSSEEDFKRLKKLISGAE